MRTLVNIFFILALNIETQAQNIYNDKGQFYLDTSLTISSTQNQIWKHAENNLVAIFSKIDYPAIYLENGIKAKGPIIASFMCDTNDISDIKILNDTSVFATAIIKGLTQNGKRIVTQLRQSSRIYSISTYVGKYYIGFSFELVDFYQKLKTLKAVPIIRSSVPLMDYPGH